VTLHQISFFFLCVLLVIVAAMFVHSWLDKRRIFKILSGLPVQIPGRIVQPSPWVYPHFLGEIEGRAFSFFFQVVHAGRQHILYSVYHLATPLTADMLLIKRGFFKPISDEARFADAAGEALPDWDDRYHVRSRSPDAARAWLAGGRLSTPLGDLSDFVSLQLGPDALVIGKPYTGLEDTDPAQIARHAQALSRLAAAMGTA